MSRPPPIFILLVMLLVARPALALADAPSISCTAPVFDFGARFNTEEIAHSFRLQNTGTVTLVITQVRTGCGCTVADIDRRTLAPGESATLQARLSLSKHVGPKQTSIFIHSNDPGNPVFLCTFTGTAMAEVEITPPAINLALDADTTGATAVVTLRNRTPFPLHPLSLDYPAPLASVQVATNEPGMNYTLTASCLASDLTDTVWGVITVGTDHPKHPRLEIPVTLSLNRPLNAFPAVMTLTAGSREPVEQTRYIILQSRDNRPFSVREIEVLPPAIPVRVHSAIPARIYLRVGPVRPTQALAGTVIRVHTDNAQMPVIDIPVRIQSVREDPASSR